MFAGVADSGANMLAALRIFDCDVLKLQCSAHKINLAVGDLINEKNIKEKCNIYLLICKFDIEIINFSNYLSSGR